MNKLTSVFILLLISRTVLAGYGADYGATDGESYSSDSLHDLVWGGIVIGIIYFLWKKFN